MDCYDRYNDEKEQYEGEECIDFVDDLERFHGWVIFEEYFSETREGIVAVNRKA